MIRRRSSAVRRVRPVLTMALFLSIVFLIAFSPLVFAAYPEPADGTATVDGNPGEWNLSADFFAYMFEAATPPDVLSKLYLRYDCPTGGADNGTLYALVLAEPGTEVIDSLTEEHFIKVGGKKLVEDVDGLPDFAFIYSGGTAIGWEASASLALGSYSDLDVHTQIFDVASNPQTTAVEGRSILLNTLCTPPTAVSLSGLDATATSSLPLAAGGITLGLAALGASLRRFRK